MNNWKNYIETNNSKTINDLVSFLRIPSISSLQEHKEDVNKAAIWVHQKLKEAKLENVEGMETEGHPVVYADWLHASTKPTILIYGHFDVTATGPSKEWNSPPFEPKIIDNKIFARGASDDKGNMLAPIVAVESLLETEEKLPVNIKFLFEGQEEIGSPNIEKFISENRTKLSCDLVISADGNQWSETEPCLLLSLRGICAMQIDVFGPSIDLHSGIYGGTIQNPLHSLAIIIAGLHNRDGSISVEGFYNDVVMPTQEYRNQIAKVPFDEQTYLSLTGAPALFGENGWSTREREWIRPTLEINGMWGGFQGDGNKTVLPASAHAKITCRLVANQEPKNILKLIDQHIKKYSSPEIRVKTTLSTVYGTPYSVDSEHPGNLAASRVLKNIYGKTPYLCGSGGSIPICSFFKEQLQAVTIGFSFALDDEGAHGPNEFFRLTSLKKSQEAYCLLLKEIAISWQKGN